MLPYEKGTGDEDGAKEIKLGSANAIHPGPDIRDLKR